MNLKTKDEILSMTKDDIAKYASETFGISLNKTGTKEAMLTAFEEQNGEYGELDPKPKAPDAPAANGVKSNDDAKDNAAADTDDETDGPQEQPVVSRGGWRHENQDLINEAIRQNKRIRIRIHGTEKEDGATDVKVAVNGKMYLIQREVEVPVPWEVLAALDNAVEKHLYLDPKDKVTRERRVKRHNVSVLGLA